MNQRRIDFKDIYWAWSKPDEFVPAQTKGAYKYYRKSDSKKISVVAKKNEDGKWVVLTCWQKEVIGWNRKNKYRHLNFWQNLWKMISGK